MVAETGPLIDFLAPKDHFSLGCNFDELKSVFSSLLLESLLHSLVVQGFLLGEDGLIIGLSGGEHVEQDAGQFVGGGSDGFGCAELGPHAAEILPQPDRKSTRLNASHLGISYAVFCL